MLWPRQNQQQGKSSLELSSLFLPWCFSPHDFEAVSVLKQLSTHCAHRFCTQLWQGHSVRVCVCLTAVPGASASLALHLWLWSLLSSPRWGKNWGPAACLLLLLLVPVPLCFRQGFFHLTCPSSSRSPVRPPSVAILGGPGGSCFLDAGHITEHVSTM